MFVARDGTRLSAFVDAFRFFAGDVEVLHFPAWDCLPYDRVGPSAGVAAQRMAILSRLAEGFDAKPRLLVTTAAALVQRGAADLGGEGGELRLARPGNPVEIADLERYFAINGYQPRLHRLGEGRVRHPRRRDRRLPAHGGRGTGAP